MSNMAATVRIAIAAGVGGGSVGGAVAGPVGAVAGAAICSVGSLVIFGGLSVAAAVVDAVEKQKKR